MFDALTDAQRRVLEVALKSHRVYVGDYLARLRGRPGPVTQEDADALEEMLVALEPADIPEHHTKGCLCDTCYMKMSKAERDAIVVTYPAPADTGDDLV